jgi:hypothetical protein
VSPHTIKSCRPARGKAQPKQKTMSDRNTTMRQPQVGSDAVVLPRTSFRYRCAHCGKITRRQADNTLPKRWIKSYCEATGKNVRLQLMPAADEITRTVRTLKKRGLWQNEPSLARRASGSE